MSLVACLRLIVCGLLFLTGLAGQTTGAVEGTVSDPSPAPVRDAEIKLT